MYGKSHFSKYLVGIDAYIGCGKMDHKVADCLAHATKDRDDHQHGQSTILGNLVYQGTSSSFGGGQHQNMVFPSKLDRIIRILKIWSLVSYESLNIMYMLC